MVQHIEDLSGFVNLFDGEKINLVGHSYGALLCLLLAINNPEKIQTLTLAEPPAVSLYISNIPKPFELLRLLFSKPRLGNAIIKFGAKGLQPAKKAFQQNNMKKVLDCFGKATLGEKPFQNLSTERLQQAKDNLIKAELLGSGFLKLYKSKLKSIHLPTLLLSGEKSPKIWHYLLDELEKLLPNTERNEILNASHIMQEDNPDAFNNAVISFLEKHN